VFYAAGRGEILKRVAAFLKGLTERGVLAIDDPRLAADQLLGAWVGMTELRHSLGVAGPPSSNAIAKRVRYAINTLVRAWSTGADPGSVDMTYMMSVLRADIARCSRHVSKVPEPASGSLTIRPKSVSVIPASTILRMPVSDRGRGFPVTRRSGVTRLRQASRWPVRNWCGANAIDPPP
jgi:hypothetical protein